MFSRTIACVMAAAICATPSIAHAADQFDLDCTDGKKETEHFRIDLIKNEWCFAKCGYVQKIVEVTSGLLKLHDHEPSLPGDSRYYMHINRITGEWSWYNYDPRYRSLMNIKGVCTPAPYSGMPSSEAKF
ncbi:MAG: hypothetical protein ACKVOB_13305 [Sphingomonas sp.]